MEQNKNGFFKFPHNFFEVTKELSVAVKLFLIYLLDKADCFRSDEFYLTDREIEKELRVGRRSINRWRKRAKMIRFIDYIPGKYKGSATTYNVKRIKMILFNGKGEPRAYQNDAKSVPKVVMKAYQNDPISKTIIKEDIKEDGDFSNPFKNQENLKNGLVREELKNHPLEETLTKVLGTLATKPMIKSVLRGVPQERWGAVRVFLSKTYPGNGEIAFYEAERELIEELQGAGVEK